MANDNKAGTDKTKEITKDMGKSAVAGAATEAVVGAIVEESGTGSAIGAAGSTTAALGIWYMRSGGPDPILKQFEDQCLTEKGYLPIGWK